MPLLQYITDMGVFRSLYEPGATRRWSMPKEADIAECKMAAIAISRFPLPLNPPTTEEVRVLIEQGKI